APKVTAGGMQELANDADLLRKLWRRHDARAHKPVAHAHRAAQRIGMTAAEPQGRMRLLQRLRLQAGVSYLPEPTLEGHPRLCPEQLEELQAFGETRHARGRIDGEPFGSLRPTEAGADDQAPPAQLVGTCERLGERDRAAQYSQKDGATE